MSMEMVVDSSGEQIVLYFDVASDGLDATTFGNALIAFDAVYRSINSILNPGLEIEVEFIRSDRGSIRAVLKSVKKDAQTLLEHPFLYVVFPFLLSILANAVSSSDVNIVVKDDSYIVQYGAKQVILPREARDKAQRVERDPTVRRTVRQFFSGVQSDPNVTSVDFRSPDTPNRPIIPIPRDKFATLAQLPELTEPALPKEKEETFPRQTVVVLTAVLEKTKRKWQFLWNGQKIWADIRDDSFFEKLVLHEYEFGQGDSLIVDLVANQTLNEFVKAYETKSYYVSRVHSHSKAPKQISML